MQEYELYHHGIKGQKWGVRRFQKKDGTLTSAGKKRRSAPEPVSEDEMTAQIKKHNLEKQYNRMLKEQEPTSKLEKTKKVVDASNEMVTRTKNIVRNSQPKPKMDLSNMTDQQLRDRINRANLERQYNDLFGTVEVSKGEKYATKILETAGDALAVTSSALMLALTIKQLKG